MAVVGKEGNEKASGEANVQSLLGQGWKPKAVQKQTPGAVDNLGVATWLTMRPFLWK